MPTSHPFQLNEISQQVITIKPEKVLEIGIGFGKYGLILREYLEIWGDGDQYKKWFRQIDGIEIFEDYIMEHHRHIYDNIYVGNALDILPESDFYDLIILIDVLEHLNMSNASKLLRLCMEKSDYILISTPKDIGDQGEGYGNQYETHLSQWSKKSLRKALGSNTIFIKNPDSHLCLYTAKNNKNELKVSYRRLALTKYVKSNFYFIFQLWKKIKH